ncbi:hypothetical protein SESBI_27847 [Sesbania bispinosa]|nr:hypothetical protein SESBI_27847 [Sesbania bispinosa]
MTTITSIVSSRHLQSLSLLTISCATTYNTITTICCHRLCTSLMCTFLIVDHRNSSSFYSFPFTNLYFVADIGKDSTTRLEWKSSPNPFLFGSFGLLNHLEEEKVSADSFSGEVASCLSRSEAILKLLFASVFPVVNIQKMLGDSPNTQPYGQEEVLFGVHYDLVQNHNCLVGILIFMRKSSSGSHSEINWKQSWSCLINVTLLILVLLGFGDAQKLFDEMIVKDVVSWSSMIITYVKLICCQAYASTLWPVPLVVRNKLLQSLELYTDMEIFFTWILSRDRPKGKEGLKYERPVDPQYLPPQYDVQKVLNGSTNNLRIYNVYPRYLCVTGSGDVRPLEEDNAISADLIIHHEQFEWWAFKDINSSNLSGLCGGLTRSMAIIISEETQPQGYSW